MKLKMLAIAAACTVISVNAAVTYDSDGMGFVGKGEIQTLLDWNNSQLQTNASQLQFRFISGGTATWVCEWWTGPSQNRKHHTTNSSMTNMVESAAALDPRKNSKGQITGFTLNGMDAAAASSQAMGTCDGNKTLVPDSLNYSGSEDPLLQVKFDGEWYDLPITL
jgi:hypothetical protein